MDYYAYYNSFRCVSVTFLELPIIVGSASVTQLNPM